MSNVPAVAPHTTTSAGTTPPAEKKDGWVIRIIKWIFHPPGKIIRLLAITAALWILYSYFFDDNHVGQLLWSRDAKDMRTEDVREGIRKNYLNKTENLQEVATTNPDAAIAEYKRTTNAQKLREQSLKDPDEGCSFNKLADPGTRNISIRTPRSCPADMTTRIIRTPSDSETQLNYHVSGWELPLFHSDGTAVMDSNGNQKITYMGPADFIAGRGSRLTCTTPVNNERDCRFVGNIMLKIPQPGANIRLTFKGETEGGKQ